MNRFKTLSIAIFARATSVAGAAFSDSGQPHLKFAGALDLSDVGTLFIGDNYGGAISAYDCSGASAPKPLTPVNLGDIDVKIADVLGAPKSTLAINDMAVHPVSAEIFISVTRI